LKAAVCTSSVVAQITGGGAPEGILHLAPQLARWVCPHEWLCAKSFSGHMGSDLVGWGHGAMVGWSTVAQGAARLSPLAAHQGLCFVALGTGQDCLATERDAPQSVCLVYKKVSVRVPTWPAPRRHTKQVHFANLLGPAPQGQVAYARPQYAPANANHEYFPEQHDIFVVFGHQYI